MDWVTDESSDEDSVGETSEESAGETSEEESSSANEQKDTQSGRKKNDLVRNQLDQCISAFLFFKTFSAESLPQNFTFQHYLLCFGRSQDSNKELFAEILQKVFLTKLFLVWVNLCINMFLLLKH